MPNHASESSGELSPAGEAFAAFLARREAGEDVDFDELCAEHPAVEARLRRLHGQWLLLNEALEEAGRPAPGDAHGSATDGTLAALRRDAPGSERLDVRGELGRGGRGRVLRVFDRDLERELAMKVLLEPEPGSGGRPDPRSLARFLDEAVVTGQLDHPGIVPVHELGLDAAGRVYFTMPVIRGEDFRRVLEHVRSGEAGWSRTRALGVLLRVCEALAFAHSRGVVHRDVKPANVMVGPFGETYVIDWGLARSAQRPLEPRAAQSGTPPPVRDTGDRDSSPGAPEPNRAGSASSTPSTALLTVEGDVLGTPAYMAPEQARGELDRITPAADVYAVGAMLYELLSGSSPHSGDTPADVLASARRGGVRDLDALARDVPPELAAICARAMAPDPDRRYPTTLELAEDLRAFLELRVVSAYRGGALAELSLWVRRNRALAAASALALALLLAGLTVSLTLWSVADRRAEDVLRLSALRDLQTLEQRADELWPATPALAPAIAEWIDRARALAEELPEHRAQLAALRREAGVDPRSPEYGPEQGRQAWWDQQLSLLCAGLESLNAPDGLLSEDFAGAAGWTLPRRLAFAAELEQRSTTGVDAAARWALAAEQARERYAGLALVPQLGLLPLGPDPDSDLLEFLLVGTGEEPERDAGGHCVVDEETGVVLVLLPGGSFLMGAQIRDPRGANYVPNDFSTNQGPVHEVELDPFFLGKHEVTQGQWLRFTGENPSGFRAGTESTLTAFDLTFPAELMSRDQAAVFAQRLGTELPTEAQWEYACRAGTTTVFETGDDVRTLEGYANLADEGSARYWGSGWAYVPEFFDDFDATSPVGALFPNRFGLHDLHGNVWEWCGDDAGSYELPVEPGTGRRLGTPEPGQAVYRGGSYYCVAHSLRSSYRGMGPPGTSADDSGLRLARRLRHAAGGR